MIKVLPLTFYVYGKNSRLNEKYDFELENYFEEIKPVFKRTGLYYNRLTKYCWFETNGRAYVYEPENFFYEFNGYVALEQDIETYRLLKNLYDYNPKVLTKDQITHVKRYEQELRYRDLNRKTLKRIVQFKNKISCKST